MPQRLRLPLPPIPAPAPRCAWTDARFAVVVSSSCHSSRQVLVVLEFAGYHPRTPADKLRSGRVVCGRRCRCARRQCVERGASSSQSGWLGLASANNSAIVVPSKSASIWAMPSSRRLCNEQSRSRCAASAERTARDPFDGIDRVDHVQQGEVIERTSQHKATANPPLRVDQASLAQALKHLREIALRHTSDLRDRPRRHRMTEGSTNADDGP